MDLLEAHPIQTLRRLVLDQSFNTPNFRFCFNPNPRPAGQGFIWRVHNLARAIDQSLMAVVVTLLGFDGYHRSGAFVFVVRTNLVLVDMDYLFHRTASMISCAVPGRGWELITTPPLKTTREGSLAEAAIAA